MNPDFLDLLRSLLAADVRFMIVGAYAVGIAARPQDLADVAALEKIAAKQRG